MNRIADLPIQSQAFGFLRQAVQTAGNTNAAQLARQVFQSGDRDAIAGMAWVAFNGLRGLMAPPKVPDIDGPALARQGLKFATHPTLFNEILFRTVGPKSHVYGRLAILQTFFSIGQFSACSAHEVGIEEFFDIYAKTQKGEERFRLQDKALEKKLIEIGTKFYWQWIVSIAGLFGLDVRFEGFEKFPLDGPSVVVSDHHAIWPDFLAALMIGRIVPVADDWNFRNGSKQRKYGVSLAVDFLRTLLIHRKNNIRLLARCMKDIADDAVDLDTKPLWFITEGREPKIRMEVRPGLNPEDFDFPAHFSNILNPNNLRDYINPAGAVRNAFDIAKRTKKAVPVPVMTIDGSHRVMPKESKHFPFDEEITTRQEIVYRIHDVLEFPYHEGRPDKDMMEKFGARIDRSMRDAKKTDQKLARLVGILGRIEKGYEGLEERFARLGEQDVGWLVAADRLRSVPPSEFSSLSGRFLDMVHSDPPVPVERLDDFLKVVSDTITAAEPK